MQNGDGEIAAGEMEREKQSAGRDGEVQKCKQKKIQPVLGGKERGRNREAGVGGWEGTQGGSQAWESWTKPGNYGVAGPGGPGPQFVSW